MTLSLKTAIFFSRYSGSWHCIFIPDLVHTHSHTHTHTHTHTLLLSVYKQICRWQNNIVFIWTKSWNSDSEPADANPTLNTSLTLDLQNLKTISISGVLSTNKYHSISNNRKKANQGCVWYTGSGQGWGGSGNAVNSVNVSPPASDVAN